MHLRAGLERELLALLLGHLGPELLAVFERQFDAHLEAEVDDALDARGARRAVALAGELEVVRADRSRRRAG